MANQLELLRGKQILFMEDEFMIGTATRRTLEGAGAVLLGPARTIEDALSHLYTDRVDGAVLDIRIDPELVFPLAERLDSMRIPYIFAAGENSMPLPANYSGFLLSGKGDALGVIAKALFAPSNAAH